MLKISNLSVNYGHVTALESISFEIPKGSIVSIIGANGAGKTTLINTISGLVKPKSGEIYFEGKLLENLPHKIVAKGIIQVPEGRKIFAGLSVSENLIMGCVKGTRYYQTRVEQVFEMFPILKERQKQQGGTLSGGEQQMLAIARAMMGDPKFLMLDEPSLGLAPILVKQIFTLIRNIREMGVTVLLVEQNAKQALSISDYCCVLEHGNILLQGNSNELLKNKEVQKAYLGE